MDSGSACQEFANCLLGKDDSNDEFRFQQRAASINELQRLRKTIQETAGYQGSLLSDYYRIAHSIGLNPQLELLDSEIQRDSYREEQIDQNQNHQPALEEEIDLEQMEDDLEGMQTQIQSMRTRMVSMTAEYSRVCGLSARQIWPTMGGFLLDQCTDEASQLKAMQTIVANLEKSLKELQHDVTHVPVVENELHAGPASQQRPSITSGSTSGSGSGHSSKSGKTQKNEFYDRFAATALEATKILPAHEMLALPMAGWNHELKPTKRI